jgi:hypothetical protein
MAVAVALTMGQVVFGVCVFLCQGSLIRATRSCTPLVADAVAGLGPSNKKAELMRREV